MTVYALWLQKHPESKLWARALMVGAEELTEAHCALHPVRTHHPPGYLLIALSVVVLGACAGRDMERFDPYPSYRLQFAPPVAKSEVNFIVLDQRPPDDKIFRESTSAKHTYLYGDRQFFPLLMRIVATHFAEAFPHDPPTIQLILRRIDVIDHVPRPYGDIRYAGDGGWADALEIPFIAAYRALHPNPNVVTCRVSGVYGGVAFDEEASVGYERVRSTQHAAAVTAAILAAITKAIDSVRTDRRNLPPQQRR